MWDTLLSRIKRDRTFAIFIIFLILLVVVTSFTTFVGIIALTWKNSTKWVSNCYSGENNWRLSRSISPTHYDLELSSVQLHPAWNYNGKVSIHMNVHETTSCVEMHAEDLNFKSVKLHEVENNKINEESYSIPSSVEHFENFGHRVKWRFNTLLQPEKNYVMVIEFSGNIRTELRGFYQSKYTTGGTTNHYLAVTQFESVFARTAFPCFDEPGLKASFKLSITLNDDHPENYKIISNTPIESESVTSNTKTVIFNKTPIMSTYLLAWVIGELDSISDIAKIGRDVPVSVYTPLGESEKAQYALEVAVKVIQEMVTYWEISESILDKMDLVAIPDFEAGAMENWGILTFRSKYLLLPQNASVSAQQGVAFVVAHEVAHQQTGNLYTAKFWNDLWLNEGFANFFEHKLINLAYTSSFDPWKIFLTAVTSRALEEDSYPMAHALTFKANTSVEIDGMFSGITYDKGASILRMLEHYLGEVVFKEWLKNFANAHKFKSVTTSDFYNALVQSVPETDALQFRTWTDQPGYPLITVEESGTNSYTVSQTRFWSHEPIEGDIQRQLWWVPVTYRAVSGDTSIKEFSLTTKRSQSFNADLFTMNIGRTGFYRVNYPKKHWERLAEHIKQHMDSETGALPTIQLSVPDRFGLVDDIIALGKAGYLRFGVVLDFLQAFKFEKELTIWDPIIARLLKFHILLGSEPSHEAFCRYVHDLLYNVYTYVGWDELPTDSMEKKQLRAIVLKALVKTGYKPAIQEALNRHDLGIPLSGNIQGLAYEAVVRERGEIGFMEIEAQFNDADDEKKLTYANAMLCSPKLSLVKRALERFTLNNEIRAQDGAYIARFISDNINAIDLGWNFVRENIENFTWIYGERLLTSKILPIYVSRFSTKVRYFEVESYLKMRNGFPQLTLDNILDNIHDNIHFRDYNFADINTWLKEKGFDNPPLSVENHS